MNNKKLFGAKIRKLRKSKNLTQEALSEIVDINPRQMVRIEMGQSFPEFENLECIAAALGVEIADLFRNEALDEVSVLKQKIEKKLGTLSDKDIRFLYSVIINLA